MGCFIWWARRAIRHKTRASQTGSHWMVPSEKPGLVFQQQSRKPSDDHYPPRVPYVLALALALWHRGEETLFISADQGNRIWSEGKWQSSQTSFLNTHAQRKQRGLVRRTKTTFEPFNFSKNKRFKTNGIRLGLNSDGVYTFRLI